MTADKAPTARKSRGPAQKILTPHAYPKQGDVRAHFDMDRELHKQLKIYAINHGQTMRQVVEEAIEAKIKPRK